MANIKCEPGDLVDLSVALYDGATNQYPQAKVYDTAGNLVTTVNLSHIAGGLYQGSYTPDGAYKHLTVHYIIYSDSGHTTENTTYSRTMDKLYVNYDYKPPGFGTATVEATISKKDKEDIVKSIIDKIDLTELLDEIRKKSEFNPKKDKVKTDIKIPTISLREVNDKLDAIKKLSAEKTKQVDYSGKFVKVDKQFKEIKELIGAEIKTVKGNIEQATKQINAIQVPEIDLQPIFKSLDGILSQNVENSRQRELLRIGIEKAMTDLFLSSRTRQEELQNKLIKELSVIREAMPGLEAMLEALNKEDFNRINLIIEELKKINQFLRVLSSMLLNKRITDEEELSGIFDLLKSSIKT